MPPSPVETHSALELRWLLGQEALAAGRYTAARQHLESAAAAAFRARDAASLARIYLPLLEARRLLRHLAVEGPIIILPLTTPRHRLEGRRAPAAFLQQPAGALILSANPASLRSAIAAARVVQYAARRRQAPLESLLLLTARAPEAPRLASPDDPTCAGGLPTRATTDPADFIQPDITHNLLVPLPPPGTYTPGHPLHALARESLLVAWEALALRWQTRHPAHPQPWQEIASLRRALRIDPACEPIAMRLIAVAEALERSSPPAAPPATPAPP